MKAKWLICNLGKDDHIQNLYWGVRETGREAAAAHRSSDGYAARGRPISRDGHHPQKRSRLAGRSRTAVLPTAPYPTGAERCNSASVDSAADGAAHLARSGQRQVLPANLKG